MKPSKFVIGMTGGVLLTMLVAAALLLGLGGAMAGAASGTPTPHTATVTSPKQGTTSATADNIPAFEQQMLQPVSDAEWSAAADQLGMSVDNLEAALKSGKTVDMLGAPRNVTARQVYDAMVSSGQARIAAAVQAGTINQAQADALNKGLAVAIADKVTHVNLPDGSPTTADQAAMQKKQAAQPGASTRSATSDAELNAAAQALGMTNKQFKTALGPDGHIANYLATHNVTAEQVKDAMLAAGLAAVDQAVQNGAISQADGAQIEHDVVQALAEKIFQMINRDQATPTS